MRRLEVKVARSESRNKGRKRRDQGMLQVPTAGAHGGKSKQALVDEGIQGAFRRRGRGDRRRR